MTYLLMMDATTDPRSRAVILVIESLNLLVKRRLLRQERLVI